MKRLLAIATVVVAAGWGLCFLAGKTLSHLLAARLGGLVTRLGEGKVSSPEEFFQHRLSEAMWLATLLLLWAFVHRLVAQSRFPWINLPRRAWIMHSLLALLGLNLWLWQANRTVLFWGLMWDGPQTSNLTRFSIKLLLLREDPSLTRAVLMGSSQTRAQIDEELLNSLLGTRLRTTELHYPGSKAYNHLMLQPVVASARADYVIIYLSEADFHGDSTSEATASFFTFGALPELIRLGGAKFVPAQNQGCGLLGQVLPMFRLRAVLAQRVFGPASGQFKQQQYDAALETNLVERAAIQTKVFASNEVNRFHQRALEAFLIRCRDSNQRVILLAGQLNPLMADRIDPQIRREMMTLLRSLATRFPHVTLVENLPGQTEIDYVDMTHVTKPAQDRFTRFLVAWLGEHALAGAEKRR